MWNAVIIDDEDSARNTIKGILKEELPEVTVCAEAATVAQGVEAITTNKPDMAFVDVRLGMGSGFDILDQVKGSMPKVIFTTAYSEYAIKAFKISAIDYLLKPIDPDEVVRAVSRVATPSNNFDKKLAVLEKYVSNTRQANRKIAISDLAGLQVVNVSDIVRCEGERNYTTLYLVNGKQLITTKSLIDFENTLDDDFFMRVHKSHLVNLNYMEQYIRGRGGIIKMTQGDAKIPVSREKKQELMMRIERIWQSLEFHI